MQFCWSLQLLTRTLCLEICFSLLLIIWRLKLIGFYGTQIFGVSRTIALNILHVFWQNRVYCCSFFTKSSFILFTVRLFFLLVYFLVLEDYEAPKSTSHILSVPVTLEYVRVLSRSISFFFLFNFLPDDVLCKTAVPVDDTALNSSYDKPSDWSQHLLVQS